MKAPSGYKLASVVAIALLLACEREAPTAVDFPRPLRAGVLVAGAGRYLVLFSGESLPADLAERVVQLGGSLEASLDGIGVAAVSGLTSTAAAELAAFGDVEAVELDGLNNMSEDDVDPDIAFAGARPSIRTLEHAETSEPRTCLPVWDDPVARPPTFFTRQCNMCAVFADVAWADGHLGSDDVVVAILDTGIDYLHPDLVGLVDLERSTSFVPEDVIPARYADRYQLPFADLFWHGTAAASIVASNATIVAGVNRDVTLIAVKIADSIFRTSSARLVSGIVYAADQGADVITISHGMELERGENRGTVAAFERAAKYAFRKGALVVSVPFNDAADLDNNGDRVRYPCEAAHVICVSATGPTRGETVNGPWENVDALASYSAFGRSAITVAAPGGDGLPNQFRRVWLPCTGTRTAAIEVIPACRFPLTNPVAQSTGTSWAAPHVAGLAALLVAQLGKGNPGKIRAKILQSADDLGEAGTDAFYGKGRVNIARALGVID